MRLKEKVRGVPWSELHLLKKHLQHGHIEKGGSHKLPQHVLDKVKDFCDESYFFWDPCHEKICFNSDVNSWERLHAEFVSINGPLLSYSSFRRIIKERIFPEFQIGRQQHTKDACDTCVAYWKAKKAFLQSLHRGPSNAEEKQDFLLLHQCWNAHI